jgi:AcrR family transcriptional regulator
MTVQERREREKLEIRDRILDAARELFIAEGYDGVSMRKVAEKIEYSPTAIYLHFADKEALFRELCHQDFGRLAQAMQGLAMLHDPVERIRQLGQAYIEFGLNNPFHYKLMFMTAHPPNELDERDLSVKGNPEMDAYAFLRLTVIEALEAGAFRDDLDDPELICQTLWGAVHGVVSLQIAKGCDYWVEWVPMQKRIDVMLDSILRGLLKQEK